MEETLIKDGYLVSEHGVRQGDLLISGETISACGAGLTASKQARRIDARGMLVFPGLVDSHVHFFAPCGGGYTADDFVSGSLCAVSGGVTTIVDYAFPREGRTLPEALELRKKEAAGYSHADFTFHAEVMGWSAYTLEDLYELRARGINSLKMYTTYGKDRLFYDEAEVLMANAKKAGLVVTVHAEDDEICQRAKDRLEERGQTGCCRHAESRPAEAESTAVRRLLQAAKKTGARVHIAHVSAGSTLREIDRARQDGVLVTCETCPHYLLLTDDRYALSDGAAYIMIPPLRTEADNAALWSGVKTGLIDSIVTDHCAFPKARKLSARSCFEVPPGIPGTETLFSLIYTEGKKRGLRPEHIVRLLSAGPARLFGIYPQKGCLQPGSDADVLMVDPLWKGNIRGDLLHSKSGYTVYENWPIEGRIAAVLRRGEVLLENGRMKTHPPGGRFVPAP